MFLVTLGFCVRHVVGRTSSIACTDSDALSEYISGNRKHIGMPMVWSPLQRPCRLAYSRTLTKGVLQCNSIIERAALQVLGAGFWQDCYEFWSEEHATGKSRRAREVVTINADSKAVGKAKRNDMSNRSISATRLDADSSINKDNFSLPLIHMKRQQGNILSVLWQETVKYTITTFG